ncbi:hypothetical protein ADUPG1_013925 [Aduncisulcus paluster]|uniref:Uncharacterized protein n=1 Tax=Aduncisulcus paluster TaxID=2918883 RepID=A0ABQ5K6N6_9EUKA|nr:hypothetical protein ADUPG1_013925 [Aduncisulcus paluster]
MSDLSIGDLSDDKEYEYDDHLSIEKHDQFLIRKPSESDAQLKILHVCDGVRSIRAVPTSSSFKISDWKNNTSHSRPMSQQRLHPAFKSAEIQALMAKRSPSSAYSGVNPEDRDMGLGPDDDDLSDIIYEDDGPSQSESMLPLLMSAIHAADGEIDFGITKRFEESLRRSNPPSIEIPHDREETFRKTEEEQQNGIIRAKNKHLLKRYFPKSDEIVGARVKTMIEKKRKEKKIYRHDDTPLSATQGHRLDISSSQRNFASRRDIQKKKKIESHVLREVERRKAMNGSCDIVVNPPFRFLSTQHRLGMKYYTQQTVQTEETHPYGQKLREYHKKQPYVGEDLLSSTKKGRQTIHQRPSSAFPLYHRNTTKSVNYGHKRPITTGSSGIRGPQSHFTSYYGDSSYDQKDSRPSHPQYNPQSLSAIPPPRHPASDPRESISFERRMRPRSASVTGSRYHKDSSSNPVHPHRSGFRSVSIEEAPVSRVRPSSAYVSPTSSKISTTGPHSQHQQYYTSTQRQPALSTHKPRKSASQYGGIGFGSTRSVFSGGSTRQKSKPLRPSSGFGGGPPLSRTYNVSKYGVRNPLSKTTTKPFTFALSTRTKGY